MVKFHTQPILGAVCAHYDCNCDHELPGHEGKHESKFHLFWLGTGSSTVYVGKCMNEPATFYSKVSNPKYEYAANGKAFKALATEFEREATS